MSNMHHTLPHSSPAAETLRSHAAITPCSWRLLPLLQGRGGLATRLATLTAATLLGLAPARAVDFHVTTAQELQNALTLAAANGADDNIYLAAGYYTGNFNFNSTENRALVLQGESGTTNTQITLDGAATGRDMNLANTGTGNFTVRGITFLRNCGSTSIGALRIAGGTGSTLLVDSCRFLSPTNTSVNAIGLDIPSGQNAIVTNCIAIANINGGGAGMQIAGVAGSVTVGGCIYTTNGTGLSVSGAGTASVVGNSFTGNLGTGVGVDATGANTFLNNSVIGNRGGGAGVSGARVTVAGNIFKGNSGGGGFSATLNNSAISGIVSNNVIANNTGGGYPYWGGGGAVGCGNGVPFTIVANTFSQNIVPGSGAGLSIGGGPPSSLTIVGNTFSGNSANYAGGDGSTYRGGGLNCSFPATITNNIFTGNTAAADGGGLHCDGACTVIGNSFIANTAGGGGGGLAFSRSFSSGTALISRNVLRQNIANSGGGGIYVAGPTATLVDNLVTKNSQTGSGFQGGGIYVSPTSTLTMVNNTLTDNTSAGGGGGLACSISGVTEVLNVYNNIIWGNSAAGNGADVWLAGTGSKKTFLYNDVHGMYGVWDIAANLLDVAPAFFDPVNGDYHLRSTSACINAGTNGAPSMPALDLDGNARTNAAIVDIGAYEFNNTSFHPADANHDWVISASEYSAYATAWKNSQTWPAGPANIPADYVTRAGFLQNQGGTYHNDGAGAPLGWKPGAN